MVKTWFIGDKGSFEETRSERMGASDLPKCIPTPENPTESLAGYDQTALTVYQEKTGQKEQDPAGLPAEMGHHNENKTLELVIRFFFGFEEGLRFRLAKERYESDCELARLNKQPQPSAREYQTGGPFLHSVQYFVDGMIVHPDMIFVGIPELKGKKERFVTYQGIKMDLSKPWNVESKNANHYAVKRPAGSMVKGYDFDLLGEWGIPKKHYMQIQFQHALLKINTGLLALMSDSADFHIWKIDADKKTQGRIMDIVGKMVKHIELRTPPRELAMNMSDVIVMIPEIKKDFVSLSGEKLEFHKRCCKEEKEADRQVKLWTQKKKNAVNAIAVNHGEFEEIRDGSEVLSKWIFRKPSIKIGKPDDCEGKESFPMWVKKYKPSLFRSMVNSGLVHESASSRYIGVKWKGEEE